MEFDGALRSAFDIPFELRHGPVECCSILSAVSIQLNWPSITKFKIRASYLAVSLALFFNTRVRGTVWYELRLSNYVEVFLVRSEKQNGNFVNGNALEIIVVEQGFGNTLRRRYFRFCFLSPGRVVSDSSKIFVAGLSNFIHFKTSNFVYYLI